MFLHSQACQRERLQVWELTVLEGRAGFPAAFSFCFVLVGGWGGGSVFLALITALATLESCSTLRHIPDYINYVCEYMWGRVRDSECARRQVLGEARGPSQALPLRTTRLLSCGRVSFGAHQLG